MTFKLKPDLEIPSAPFIGPFVERSAPCPEAERVSLGLTQMSRYARDFISSIALYQFCKLNVGKVSPELLRDWMFMAARDGGMSLNHFHYSMEAARNNIKFVTISNWTVDLKQLKYIRNRFVNRFPGIEKIRHAIAHSAELFVGGENSKINGSKCGVTISGSLVNDKWTDTIDGRLVEYELSSDSAQFMAETTQSFFAQFPDILKAFGIPGLDQTFHQS